MTLASHFPRPKLAIGKCYPSCSSTPPLAARPGAVPPGGIPLSTLLLLPEYPLHTPTRLLGYQVKKNLHSHETHKIQKFTISNPRFYPSAFVSHKDHRSDKTVPAYPSAAISSTPVQYKHSRLRRRNQAGNGITSAGTVQQSLDWILSELQPLGVCRVKIIGGKLTEG
jgi:hypothetical protein